MSAAAAMPTDTGRLAENVVHFARVLRRAGLPIGPARVLDALQAVAAVGIARRDDFRAALSTVLVDRHEQQPIFDQAFALFWRDPSRVAHWQQWRALLDGVRTPVAGQPAVAPRVTQAMQLAAARGAPTAETLPPELKFDAALTTSQREALLQKDFAAMTAEEMAETRRMMASLRIPLPALPSRRIRPSVRGRHVDLRGALRRMVRSGDDFVALPYRAPRPRPATLAILCDISGSMESYTRMLLHFMHAISNQGDRVHTFLFGTRLSNITRALRGRDVDVALAQVSRQVADWAGGTRIGACLQEFNRAWARRVLGQGAVVLLISDGLDSDDAGRLGAETARLRLACRQLIWLNPLLRFEGFEAKPAGIRAMLPHVDRFLPAHNLDSLTRLGAVLAAAASRPAFAFASSHHSAGDHHGNVQHAHRAGPA